MIGPDISRREFLRGGSFALGGLVAASSLPAVAGDRPELFPRRGRWERLSIACHHIKAGAEKPFSILHISDTHLTASYPDEGEAQKRLSARRSLTFGGRQEEALRDSLAWAKQHVDYVLHTGDLIDWQTRANFDLVRKYYGEGASRMFGCLGNHEHSTNWLDRKSGRKDDRAALAAAYPFDNSLAGTVVNGVNFVTIDDSPGTVSAEQATRFEAEVKKGLPLVLCMHVPFSTPHIWRAATKFWARNNLLSIPDASKYRCSMKDPATKEFLAYIKAQPLLKGVLAGHLHIDVVDRLSPTANEYVVGGNFLFHGAEIMFT